jgi:hypothetical protein
MTCSSRISRIIPRGLPLTWESIPADFQPIPQPLLAFNDATLKRNGDANWSLIAKGASRRCSPTTLIPDFPTIIPPTPTLKNFSLESPRPRSSLPTTKHERHRYDASKERSENSHNAISSRSMRERHVSPGYSRHTPAVEYSHQQDMPPHMSSSHAFTTGPDKTRWTPDATSLRRRHSRLDEPTPPNSTYDTATHHHRYDHVVRTDVLAPCPAPRKDCKAYQPSADPRQPWLTDNHEIDWATYFRS